MEFEIGLGPLAPQRNLHSQILNCHTVDVRLVCSVSLSTLSVSVSMWRLFYILSYVCSVGLQMVLSDVCSIT